MLRHVVGTAKIFPRSAAVCVVNKWLYLSLDVGSVLVPFIFSFHSKLQFNKQFRFAFPAIIITAVLFIAWDIAMTQLGVWGFNNDYVTGVYVYNLPLEEVLFFICIPFSCLFTYHCLLVLKLGDAFENYSKVISAILSIALVAVGVMNYSSTYTASTFLLLGLMIALLQFGVHVKWLGQFYFSFLVLLIPFFMVNGILTGTGLSDAVVWYNNNENLGFRLLTIPVEDMIYGMLFQLTNVALFESMRKQKQMI